MSIPDDERTIDDVDEKIVEPDEVPDQAPDEVRVSPLPESLSIPLEVPEADAIEQALEVDGDEIYPRED
jgi:hypothetical protein